MIGKNKFTATFLACCVLCCVLSTAIISAALTDLNATGNNSTNSSVTNSTAESNVVLPNDQADIHVNSLELIAAPLNPAFVEYQKEHVAGTQNTRSLLTSTANSGLLPSPIDLRYLGKINAAESATFPSSYDLRVLSRVTSVKNQIVSGNCWSFATFGSLESNLAPNETWDFSENNLKNNVSSSSQGGFDYAVNSGGTQFMATAYLTRWSGPIAESDDPYNPYNYILIQNPSVKKHVQNVSLIAERDNSTDNNEIKWAIERYGAITADIYANINYYNSTTHSYYYNGVLGADHTIDIVGWNDTFDKNNFTVPAPANGAFIVKNSEGVDFGENGYFYVSYYDSNLGMHPEADIISNSACFAFTAENTSNYQHIYQYDPLGWTNTVGYPNNNNNTWCANNFTASSDQVLKAVSFYATDVNCHYEIYIAPSSTDLSNRQLVGNGIIDVAGYHTIPLNRTIILKKGQQFAVELNLTTPNYNFPIAIEYQWSGYSSNATANANESFISKNGSIWTDLTTVPDTIFNYHNSNVCIKAFTDDAIIGTQTASFTTNLTDGYTPLAVQFNDTSINGTDSTWDFGDGSTSPEKNPVHTFNTGGNYTVTLTSFNGSNVGSISHNIIVFNQSTPESPMYAYIANSGGLGKTAQVLDVINGTTIGDAIPVGNSPQGVAVSKDRKTVYIVNTLDESVSMISTATNSVIGTVFAGIKTPYDVAVSPNTSKIYVTSNDAKGFISVVNTITNTFTAIDASGMLWGIAISPDGSKVYVANGGNVIDVMDTSNNTIIKAININGSPRDVVISPDGKYAYVTNNTGNKVVIIDTASYNVLTEVPVNISPAGIAITPDGKRVYVANNGGSTVSVIDTTTNTVIKTVNVGAQPFGIAVSPDGREVCVTNNAGASISTINVATNSVINTISTQAFPGGIAIYSKPAQPIISPNVVSFIATPSESNNAPFIVYFNGSTTQGDAANMHWDFGDGRTIDSIHKDATVANSYNLAGSYTVKLTVTYRDASTNNTSQSISVAAVPHKPINADFVGAPLSGIASLNVQFTDNSTGADNWFYVFGDNGSAIAKNPAHIYKTPGSYSVAQIAFNTTTSLYDAIVKKGYVNVADANGTVPQTPNNIINAPISDIVINDFTANVTSGSAPLNVAFTSNVSGLANVRTWTWIFEPVGNDYYSTSINTAIHTFTHVGKFDVTLILTNKTGAVASLTKTAYITVTPLSPTNLTVGSNSALIGSESSSSFTSTPVSTVSPVNPVSTASSAVASVSNIPVVSNAPTPVSTPVTTTTPVTSGVSSSSSGWSTGDRSLISTPTPTVIQSPSAFTLYGHVNSVVDFSSTIKAEFIGVTWNFQDGKGSHLVNPTHVYTEAGTYPVTLTAKTSDGLYIKKVVGTVIIT